MRAPKNQKIARAFTSEQNWLRERAARPRRPSPQAMRPVGAAKNKRKRIIAYAFPLVLPRTHMRVHFFIHALPPVFCADATLHKEFLPHTVLGFI